MSRMDLDGSPLASNETVAFRVMSVDVLRGFDMFWIIGTNALALYLAYNIVDFQKLASRLVGGDIQAMAGRYGQLLVCTTALGLVVCLAGFLHRQNIFIRA